MSFNLNKSNKPDYDLTKNNIEEMINIYGVNMNFIYTTKMNKDKVLQDWSHFVSTQDSYEIYLLPEDTSNWSNEMNWDIWGLHNLRTVTFFMSANTYEKIFEYFNIEENTIINSLLITPNGTILEISDLDYDFEGGNNLFLFNDKKSVYRITTRVYNNNISDEITINDDPSTSEQVTKSIEDGLLEVEFNEDEISQEAFDTLDKYLKSLDDIKVEQDEEGDQFSNSDSVFGSLG
jgi:hypothetical protein